MQKTEALTGDARQQLLNRILSSRQFAHAHILKRVLSYICEYTANPDSPAPKEYDIAVHAMRRPGSFDPRTDPIVRVSIASIRDRLFAYFATEGKHEPVRLEIPKGQYRAVFMEAASGVKAENGAPRALAKFWQPYFTGAAANVIVYTEPLFFRDDDGRYFRDWHVNDPATGVQELGGRLPGLELGNLVPSYHYISAGEVYCMLSITRMFHEVGVPVETRNSRISSWNELSHSNLILIGSPRTNTFLDSLQGGNAFVITPETIENRKPAGGEQPCYGMRRYMDGKLTRMIEHAVVTQRPGLTPGCTLTIIAANHGRAIEGAGHFLTLEDKVQRLLDRIGAGDRLPKHFQFLMKVETVDIDDEVAHVDCVSDRILEW